MDEFYHAVGLAHGHGSKNFGSGRHDLFRHSHYLDDARGVRTVCV